MPKGKTKTSMWGQRVWQICLSIVACLVVFCFIGYEIASAETAIHIGTFSEMHTVEINHEYTIGINSEQIIITTRSESSNVPSIMNAYIGGVKVSQYEVGAETVQTFTFDVPASGSWKIERLAGSEPSIKESSAIISYEAGGGGGGGEGKEGKEGKEGPEGKEGKEGKEGLEGKMGEVGPEGKSGSGEGMENVSFSPAAQENLSEMKDDLETVGWCIVGCILAMALFFMVYTILKVGRR